MKRKRSNRRTKNKFPALNPLLNLKTRIEEITDIDYVHKLNTEEKQWLNNFMEEWVNANLDHSGKKFHKSKKSRKIVYDRNNARNRDVFSQSKAQNKLNYIDNPLSASLDTSINTEDELILKYDLTHNIKDETKGKKKK